MGTENESIMDVCNKPKKKLFVALVPALKTKHAKENLDEYLIGNALILNKNLLENDYFTSAIVKKFEAMAKETKLGLEEITKDVPGVGERALANLDEQGIVKAWTVVKKGDLLIGKSSPKSKAECTPEERMLYAIFGTREDVKNTSIEMPYEDEGIVFETEYLSRLKDKNAQLPFGVLELARVYVLMKKKLEIGDILQDKAGSKGVVAKFSRLPLLKIGHSHKYPDILAGYSSAFASSLEDSQTKYIWRDQNSVLHLCSQEAKSAGAKCEILGKAKIGYLTLERLTMLAEEKISARSTGAYGLITQQPLQHDSAIGDSRAARFTEKEISCLKSCPELVKEALTLRSDAAGKRANAYEELLKHGKF